MKTTAATSDCGTGPPRFVRRTTLGANEYRKNFHQIDGDVAAAVTSPEADRVTPLMSKIYLRLASAPPEFWEREGVLYFTAGDEGGRPVKASKVLYELLGVASGTAHKALQWMHGQGIIGYFAGKNGAGIRIFLNRASTSIGVRTPPPSKKILPFARGSSAESRGSADEPAFNDSFAVSEILDSDNNPHAPKNGAEQTKVVKTSSTPQKSELVTYQPIGTQTESGTAGPVLTTEIAEMLLAKLEPVVRTAAAQAAAREHERTREWLESRGLPKAARVAQREAFNVLRKCGVVKETAHAAHADVGRGGYGPKGSLPLTDRDVTELAHACVALLEAQGRSIEVTLSEMSVEAGGFLLPEDASKVREQANVLLSVGSDRGGKCSRK